MRRARVLVHARPVGELVELEPGRAYRFAYLPDYAGPPVSLTMPLAQSSYHFDHFPPFFDGLLPEGVMLEALLRQAKIDQRDFFSQLVVVGADLVGAVTIEGPLAETAADQHSDHEPG